MNITKSLEKAKSKGGDALKTSEELFESLIASRFNHKHVIVLGIGALLVSWILIILIDILNVFGLRENFYHGIVPTFWHYTFREAGPIEHLQYTFLAGLAVTGYYLYAKTKREGSAEISRFWGLFSVAGILGLAENWLDIRHLILREWLTLDWTLLNLLETSYFLLLGIVPLAAIILYGSKVKSKNPITLSLVVVGGVFYVTAIFLSGPADLTGINSYIGNTLYDVTGSLGGDELQELHREGDHRISDLEQELGTEMMDVRYRFKDLLVEESLELIGSTFLLAAAFSYFTKIKTGSRIGKYE